MNELRIFKNPEFGEIRTVFINGKEYFYGTDIARALHYERPSKAVSDNCKGVLTEDSIKNEGGYPEKLITEGDMYRLIVKAAVQSNSATVRKAADRFERWIFDEVLPEIRRTGAYIVEKKQDSYTIENPAERARRWAEEYEEKKRLEEKVTELQPKAHVYDKLIDSRLLVNFRDAAKEIGISQTQFTGWLKNEKYIYATQSGELRPMETYMESGLFQMKPYQNPYNGYCGVRTYLTPTGLATFKLMLDTSDMNRDNMPKYGGRKRK